MCLAEQIYELEQMDQRGEVIDPSKVDPMAYEWFLDRKIEMVEDTNHHQSIVG